MNMRFHGLGYLVEARSLNMDGSRARWRLASRSNTVITTVDVSGSSTDSSTILHFCTSASTSAIFHCGTSASTCTIPDSSSVTSTGAIGHLSTITYAIATLDLSAVTYSIAARPYRRVIRDVRSIACSGAIFLIGGRDTVWIVADSGTILN